MRLRHVPDLHLDRALGDLSREPDDLEVALTLISGDGLDGWNPPAWAEDLVSGLREIRGTNERPPSRKNLHHVAGEARYPPALRARRPDPTRPSRPRQGASHGSEGRARGQKTAPGLTRGASPT
ncbi:MAG: hypothetical protein ABJE95_22070 [Byssovorax sp.]